MRRVASQLWPRSEGVVWYFWGSRVPRKLCSVGWKEKVAVVAKAIEGEEVGRRRRRGTRGGRGKKLARREGQ